MLTIIFLYVAAINFSQALSEPDNTLEYVPCVTGWYYWGEKCYMAGGQTVHNTFSWQTARETCMRFGGDLVSIQSQQEQDFAVTFLQLHLKGGPWIGLHDISQEGDFRWSDGSVLNYSNWKIGTYPNGTQEAGKNCTHLIFEPENDVTGTWSIGQCNKKKPYICETKPNFRKRSPNPMICSNEGSRGWQWEKSCYHVVNISKAWKDAKKHCRNYFGGHLVSILDKLEDEFLDYMLPDIKGNLWIGIKIKEQLQQKWTSGWFVSYDGFKEDTEIRDGTCAARKGRSEWITIPCTEELPFVCEVSAESPLVLKSPPTGFHCPVEFGGWRDLGGEYCYHFETRNALSFYEALFDCKRIGGSLASVHSKEENSMLVSFVKYKRIGKHVWIGLLRSFPLEEKFTWTDGSAVDYVNWSPNQPDNFKSEEACVELATHAFGYIYTWNDDLCSRKRGYICSVKKTSQNVPLEDEKCKGFCIYPRSYLYEIVQQSEDAEEMKCSANKN